jgi:hypothetical protein
MSIEFTMARTFCGNKELYDRHEGYLHTVVNIAKEWKTIFILIKDFYLEYNQDEIDAQELHDYYDLKFPNARNAEDIHMMITEIFTKNPKPAMIQAIMEQFIEKHKAATMIDMLADTMTGDKFGRFPEVVREVESFHDIMENPPEEISKPEPVTMSIEELIETELVFQGMEWPIEEFNDILGGIRRRTLGLIYAFVDCGKTSLAMLIAAHAAHQLFTRELDDCVCYCGNEEPAGRIALRGVQAFMHCTRSQLLENPKHWADGARELGYDNMRFFGGMDTGDQIISVVKEFKPRLLIVDIATDVDVQMERHYGTEGVGYLKSLFKWYRRLSNRFDMSVLGVVQGTGDIEDKRYPKLSDVFGSRSAVQGALDYAIGIGRKPNDLAKAMMRYINIPKNKLHDGLQQKIALQFEAEVNRWN